MFVSLARRMISGVMLFGAKAEGWFSYFLMKKEIALYTASKISSEFCWFDINGDIEPLFKEYWCKRLHPKNVCEKVYRQPPLRESLKKGKLRKQDISATKQKTAVILIRAADLIGKKIQYSCSGFLPNKRQHRMAGLAAIEIAQKVSKAWRSLQAEWKSPNRSTSKHGKRARRKEKINILSQNRGGACCSTSSSSEPSTSYGIVEDRSSGRPMMSWHDVYSLAVKWRQISEPCDPVVWVNKLRGDNVIDLSDDGKLQDALCNAYCGESYGSTDFSVLENVRDAILRLTYYWYNFMPLSRGSAAIGFIVLLGLFLAANMEFTGSIPQGLQVDWEAILTLDPNSFVDSVKSWLYPSLKVTTSWKDYPDVASTFETTGSVVAALSSYSD
ncbi:hypothetical protein HYC85_002405 [Camellia sinensis]|uniref:Uncharacterized protein n=1 Tax=Camellia sinensis TaxID=4442 RepID=A0A7J7I9K0_CAMSI|nr:hypothetical protein HYC85_002405 [Camellia sinensis]